MLPFSPDSFLQGGASPFSPIGGGVDDISPPTPMVATSSATANAQTRVQFSTGNMGGGGSGLLNPANLGIIGIAALIGIVLLKVL